jgi:hypothetical protein
MFERTAGMYRKGASKGASTSKLYVIKPGIRDYNTAGVSYDLAERPLLSTSPAGQAKVPCSVVPVLSSFVQS